MLSFLHWRQHVRPPAWSQIFGADRPLEVEIGFGNGDYLVRHAGENPAIHFVGLEPEWTPVQRTLRKLTAVSLTNVRVLQIDARVALERLFTPRSIDRMYCLFPCPWPKKRHVKYRLFSKKFLQIANSRLRDGAELTVVTDDLSYFEWIGEQVPQALFDVRTETVGPGFETKYERRWRAEGQEEFFRITLAKTSHYDLALVEDETLETHLVEHFSPEGFQPAGTHEPTPIEFKDSIFDERQGRMVVRTIASEEGLTQDFWVEIVRRDDGWRVRPLRGCGVVPTRSVQQALDHLASQMMQSNLQSTP